MSKRSYVIVALVLLLAGALYAWSERSAISPRVAAAPAGKGARAARAEGGAATDPHRGHDSNPVAAPNETQAIDQGSNSAPAGAEDTLELARMLLPAARRGDADAQFQLFSALAYCERLYNFYFVRGDARKTLDEALVCAARRPDTSAEEAREVHRRCHTLMDRGAREFGQSDDWLMLAVESGHGEAQLIWAERV